MIYEKELEFAKRMAVSAGEVMEKYYRVDQGVELKDDSTPVTLADKEINDMLIQQVKGEYPEYGVLGEEASWEEGREKLWVCDPIDGTVGYILHIPMSTFTLALVIDGVVKVAVAYNPWVDDLYCAVEGKGAFRGDQQITVSSKKWGENIHVASGGSGDGNDIFKNQDLVQKLAQQKVFVNNSPGIAYHGCLMAEGSIEGRVFAYHSAHDIAAIKLIIEEAGGKVTDLDGNEQRYDRPINGAVMSNGLIHEELLQLVKDAK